ncbi:MAG: SpoIIIAH-like family protein [Lachnospiraceae bacterium]|nr:SpoIIIAH-like family protein [Lachnospiraceae bacterium]
MKKLRFRKNQIIITVLALMIAVAGYVRYADKNLDSKTKSQPKSTKEQEASANTSELIDMESLDADITDLDTDTANVDSKDGTDAADSTEATGADVGETPGEAVLTGASAYMAQAKLDREQIRSQNKETLLDIINNEALTEEERQNAVESMVAITDAVEKEAAAEMLLEAQGFTNSVVNLTGDTADVVVPVSQLADDQRAQIEDIVTRKTGVEAENIVITPID